MNKKRGFTLIELLAVIVILAVIALIATPIIMNVINDSKIGANKDSVYGYINASTYQLFKGNVEENKAPKTYTVDSNGQLIDGSEKIVIDSKGTKPSGGAVTFNSDGRVGAALLIDNKCYVKYLIEDEVRVLPSNTKCDSDISSNLVVNGYGELQDNTNFSKFDYTSTGFNKSGNISYAYITSDKFIPIDPNKEYTLSADFKTSDSTTVLYAGFQFYDNEQVFVEPSHFLFINNTLTTLARDLKDGDTVVYLKDASKFIDSTYNYQLGLIFWNYQDKNGKVYSALTYSRNAWIDLYEQSGINRTNNTITLKKPWDKGTIKSGTEVSQSNSSGFNYGFVNRNTVGTTYINKTYKVKGENVGDSVYSYSKFAPTTKYIKFMTYPNYFGVSGNTTSFRNLSIKETNG